MAAAVAIGSRKMRSHCAEHEIAGDEDRAALVALGQQA